MRRRPGSAAAIAALGLLLLLPPAVLADGTLAGVEDEFRQAVRRVLPATVTIVARNAPRQVRASSSGVIVSPEGYVLSDGDVGLTVRRVNGREQREWTDDVEVRVPDPGAEGQRPYAARVVIRDQSKDVSWIRMLQRPAGTLPYVLPGSSDALEVGDFLFITGTAFDDDGRGPPTMTAGQVAAVTAAPPAAGRGRYDALFTTAAINEGVNGGPVVDLDGRLVGTVSTYLNPEPDEPHQFLGRINPIEALRGVIARDADAARILQRAADPPRVIGGGRSLEIAFREAAARAYPGLLSLEIERSAPIVTASPLDDPSVADNELELRRYRGPVSALLVSQDGWVVTSLYNVANVGTLVEPLWEGPAGADVETGLRGVTGATLHLAGGRRVPARLVGHDPRLGVVLFKAELESLAPPLPVPIEVAPADQFRQGRFVLGLGNPYGAARPDAPLLGFGVLSKYHEPDTAAAWRGQWQTDAPGLDSNCGGAAVDLEGRLLGMLMLWHPIKHGRNSGIAFIVPWGRIMEALPAMQAGVELEKGLFGVRFAPGLEPVIEEVVPGSGAEAAGVQPGDVIRRVDREPVATTAEAVAVIRFRYAGERVHVTLERRGTLVEVAATLGAR